MTPFIRTLGVKQRAIAITDDEFSAIVQAKQTALVALSIEEKFELFLANYADFEKTLLGLSLGHMLSFTWDWTTFQSERSLLDRRLANLLSSARLYVDQVVQDVTLLGQDPEAVKSLFKTEYDAHVEYRVIEALRNYVQHRSLPVGQISYPNEWIGRDRVLESRNVTTKVPKEVMRQRHTTTIHLDLRAIRADGAFKQSVLAELEALNSRREKLSITPMVRKYVELVAGVHETVRTWIQPNVEAADVVLAATVARARLDSDPTPVNTVIAVRPIPESPREAEQHYVFTELTERRQSLMQKYSVFTNLSVRFVTGDVF